MADKTVVARQAALLEAFRIASFAGAAASSLPHRLRAAGRIRTDRIDA